MRTLDRIIFILVSICFIFYVYQFPVLNTLDDRLAGIIVSLTGANISIVGLLLRFLIPLVLLKIYLDGTIALKPTYNKVLVRLLVLVFAGVLVSKTLTTFLSPEVARKMPYDVNSLKVIIRYFTMAFALGSVMNNRNNRLQFIRILLVTGFVLIISKQFNLMGSASMMGFEGTKYTTSGEVLGYTYESFGALDKNYYALLLGVNIILATGYIFITKRWITKYVFLPAVIVLSGIDIILSMSLGGIVSTAGGVGGLLYYQGKLKRWYFLVVFLAMIWIVLGLTQSTILDQLKFRILETYATVRPAFTQAFSIESLAYTRGTTLTTRIGATLYAVDLFNQSPLYGYGGYKDLTSPIFFSGTHTTYLAWLTQFGLITLLPLIYFIYTVLQITRKRMKVSGRKSDDFNVQVILYSIFITLLINGFVSPVMLLIIIFASVALYNDNSLIPSEVKHLQYVKRND